MQPVFKKIFQILLFSGYRKKNQYFFDKIKFTSQLNIQKWYVMIRNGSDNDFGYVRGQNQVKNLDFGLEISNNVHFRPTEAIFCLPPTTTFNKAERPNYIGNRCIRDYSKPWNHSQIHFSNLNVLFGRKRVKIFQITYLGSITRLKFFLFDAFFMNTFFWLNFVLFQEFFT